MQSTIRKMLFIIIVCSALAALLWYFPSFHIAPNDPIFIGGLHKAGELPCLTYPKGKGKGLVFHRTRKDLNKRCCLSIHPRKTKHQ